MGGELGSGQVLGKRGGVDILAECCVIKGREEGGAGMGCLRTWRQPQLLAHARGSTHHWASTLAILSMLRSNCVALSP